MSLAIPMPERPRRARGRLQLLAIIGLVVGPMLLASAMYKWNFWVPQGRSYSGALIGNGQTPADLGVQGRSQGEQWQLLVTAPGTCGEDCQQLVYLARQVNIALGREASRAGHALAASGELPADFANLVRQDYPRLQRYGLTRPCTTRPAAASGRCCGWSIRTATWCCATTPRPTARSC